MSFCRHCTSYHISPTFASVALLENKDVVECVNELESQGIVPCVTAMCSQCNNISLILYNGVEDPVTHTLAIWKHFKPYLS